MYTYIMQATWDSDLEDELLTWAFFIESSSNTESK